MSYSSTLRICVMAEDMAQYPYRIFWLKIGQGICLQFTGIYRRFSQLINNTRLTISTSISQILYIFFLVFFLWFIWIKQETIRKDRWLVFFFGKIAFSKTLRYEKYLYDPILVPATISISSLRVIHGFTDIRSESSFFKWNRKFILFLRRCFEYT